MKASDFKKGMVIDAEGKKVLIKEIQVQSPSSRSGSTLYKVKGRDLISKQKFERSFKGDESANEVDFLRREVQFLYQDGDGYTFMDIENYDQHTLDAGSLEEERFYLTDGLQGIYLMLVDDAPIGLQLPTIVELDIVETAPGIKGASASARTKPATLSTGLVVQVPEYISPEERLKVNAETGEFVSRA